MRALALAVLMAIPQPALADPSDPSDGRVAMSDVVRVQLWSVHALREGSSVDDGLVDIAKHLDGLQYGTFRLLDKHTVSLAPNGSKRIETAGGLTVRITILDRSASRARARVQIDEGSGVVLDTTVSIHRNGFFIVAGPRYQGGMLVLPIFARY